MPIDNREQDGNLDGILPHGRNQLLRGLADQAFGPSSAAARPSLLSSVHNALPIPQLVVAHAGVFQPGRVGTQFALQDWNGARVALCSFVSPPGLDVDLGAD